MWLAKPFYESIPLVLVICGLAGLLIAAYVDSWYWAEIGSAFGLVGLLAGIVLLLRRRGYRASRSRISLEDSE
jgi:uncharacterized membrane protein YfcA